jgi:hypothetical protein
MDIDNDGWAATRLPWDPLSLDQAETVTTLIPNACAPRDARVASAGAA